MSGPFDIFGLGANPDHPEDSPARKAQRAMAKPLPKRFYDVVTIAPSNEGYQLHLDAKPVRTPARRLMTIGNETIARLVAQEWQAQKTVIDPKTMPLTRLANSALDGVAHHKEAVRDEIVRFAGTDLLFYRADQPARLVERQSTLWDPVVAAAEAHFGCRFVVTVGLMHVTQPERALKAVAGTLAAYDDPLRLAALHSMTTLMGSCLLALNVAEGAMPVAAAWQAAHLDEDWNIELWGEDREAQMRRAFRLIDMEAAAKVATACIG